MDSTTNAVATSGLTKRYGSRRVVDGLDLVIPAGSVAGFIGPNGAGKTTTMAMLLGLVSPTSGTGTVLGRSLADPGAYLGQVGALVEAPALWPSLTGAENLRVLAALGGHDRRRVPEVLATVGLADRAHDRFREYSMGMRQRLGIAAALLGDPALLVLDEPTNGLDPAGMTEVRTLVTELAAGERTLLVSSHLLGELEQVCDWLVIVDDGRLRYQGPAREFLGQASTVVVGVPEHDADAAELVWLARAEGLAAERRGGELVVTPADGDHRAAAVALNRTAIDAGIVLAELSVRRPSLESHYLATLEASR